MLAFGLVYTSWGTTYLAILKGVRDEQLPPALFGGTRVCLAGLIVLAYLAASRRNLRIARRDWIALAVSSLCLFLCGNGLMNAAERTVDSGVAAVLAATTPLWIGLMALCWPGGERLTLRGWLGLAVGLGGVLILLSPKLRSPAAFVEDIGPLLALGSAFAWALGSLVLRHHRPKTTPLTAAAYQMILGGGALTLLGILLGETRQLPERVTPGAVGAFVYLLVVGSLVGFVAFNWLLSHAPASQVSTYAYVNPMVAVLVGWVAGEPMTGWLLGGIAVILVGVALVRGGQVSAIKPTDGGPWAAPADPAPADSGTTDSGKEEPCPHQA